MKVEMRTLILAAVGMIMLSGCKKDEEGTLQVTFKGIYGNDPLVMFETRDYANGQRFQFSRSEFFISDLDLIDGSGNEVDLSDIELVDLTFSSESAAEAGVTFTFNNIPAGSYSNLRFGFGVASDINATTPSDYPSSSPLSNAGRYWTPWTSFIFSKTEGNLDTLTDGTDNPDLGFAYHTGTDNLFRGLQINQNVSVTEAATTHIIFYLDHESLMGLPNAPIDIKAKPQNHNPQDIQQIQTLVDNLIASITFSVE